MKILICDTSTPALNLVLYKDGETFSAFINNGKKHNGQLLVEIDKLLKENNVDIKDIDYFSAVTGPGSFTGIRVGVTMMNGFAHVGGKKMVEINSFEMISYGIKDCVALIHARRNFYYGAKISGSRIIKMAEYTEADLDMTLERKVFMRNVDHSENLVKVALDKIENSKFVDMLKPLYLKESQADREFAMKNNKLTPMTAEDLEQVLEIENDVFTTPYTKQMYLDYFNNENVHLVALKVENEVLGYATLLQIMEQMHIMNIAVKNSYQRQGYGEKLLNYMIDFTKKGTAEELTLEVRESNTPAQKLYEKFGFVQVGKRPKYYNLKEDALLYTLKIGDK